MAQKSWRLGLRAYLADTLKDGVAPSIGELVERFADEIPLHSAARKWATNGRGEQELPPAYRMRAYTLTQELHWLQCTFSPPGRKTYDTTVVVHGMVCPNCGELHVCEKRKPSHGTLCPAWAGPFRRPKGRA